MSLLFLNARTRWMYALSDWTADEILMKHSTAVNYLLNDLQAMLADGLLRGTGFLALLYTVGFLRKESAFTCSSDGRNC
jgi:hypothetical protein